MNERIKQLYDQSQKVGRYTDGGYTEIYGLDAEKFAELIVGECAGIIEAIENGNQIEGTDNPIKAIRKRFGV